MAATTTEQGSQVTDSRKVSPGYHLPVILLLAVFMYYLFDSATDEEVLGINRLLDMSEQDYDYFMAGVDSIHYTADGHADYRFRATRVTHYPNPGYSLIEAPRFDLFQEDDSAWRINALSGRVELDAQSNQERLILNDNVIINGITADGRPVTITTDSLTLYPGNRTLVTDRAVRLESEGLVSTSSGLHADLNTNVIRQLGNGQMQYEETGQGQ